MSGAKYKSGDAVYWVEPPGTVRSGVVIRITGNRYVVRRGYEQGVSLPESRLFPTYEAAAATLPEAPVKETRKGRWHWWLE